MRKNLKLITLVAAFALVLAACGGSDSEPTTTAAVTTTTPATVSTIVDVATEAGSFTTLLAAAEAAGLVATLQGDGPFTVFAPTDEAFAALPAGTVEALLADIPALTEILLYHVVSGEVLAADVVGLTSATTVQGSDIGISVTDGSVVLNNSATVVTTDIMADNGIIHVIDAVILPPADDAMGAGTIVDVAAEAGSFTTLLAAAEAAGLVATLQGDGPFTVFAPTDEAFAQIPEDVLNGLLADVPALTSILTYHVVPGKVLAADVVGLDSATTVQGSDIAITVEDGSVMLNNAAMVITTDIMADNGIIHVIDLVLSPPEN